MMMKKIMNSKIVIILLISSLLDRHVRCEHDENDGVAGGEERMYVNIISDCDESETISSY